MHKFLILLFAVMLFAFSNHISDSNAQSFEEVSFKKDRIYIKITPDAYTLTDANKPVDQRFEAVSSIHTLNTQFGVQEIRPVFITDPRFVRRHQEYGLDRWFEIVYDASINVDQIVELYTLDGYVEIAEPVFEYSIMGEAVSPIMTRDDVIELLSTNDPRLGDQWHYNNTGQQNGTPGSDISLFDAWEIETGHSDVIVQVVDTGIDLNHPDLQNMLWINPVPGPENGYNGDLHGWSHVTNSTDIQDTNGHGSHVAGTIAAENDNGIGVAGVAGGDGSTGSGVRIMTSRVFTESTGGSGFAQAVVYGADNGAVIANHSWGGGGFSQALRDAILYFIDNAGYDGDGNPVGPIQGGLLVFAAGNNGSGTPTQPIASNPEVLSIAATNNRDRKSWYSQHGSWVDMAAPGGETNTVTARGVLSTVPGGYQYFQGTSMAAPHAAGVAALVASKYRGNGMSGNDIKTLLMETVDPIDHIETQYDLGTGRLNAYAALLDDDGVPPATITDLSIADDPTQNSISIEWTSPGSSGMEGRAASYDIRFSTSVITPQNFTSATQASNIPAPMTAGTVQSLTLEDLNSSTEYFIAMRARDLFGNNSDISNVVNVTTEGAPVIQLSTTELNIELDGGETGVQTLNISNTGEGPLQFMFPGFESTNFNRTINRQKQIDIVVENSLPERKILDAFLGNTYRNDVEINDDVVNRFIRNENEAQLLANETTASNGGVLLEFENLSLEGSSFTSFNEGDFTGELTHVGADFILNQAASGAWASDLAVLFIQGSELTTDNIVLQVGGFTEYRTGTRIAWGTGNGGTGTPVNTTIEIPTPLDMDNIYVWIGNAWANGGVSTWSGSVLLGGVNDKPEFITDVNPANGTLQPGENIDVDFTFSASGLMPGNYEGIVRLASNDLSNPTLEIQVGLEVTGGAPELVLSTQEINFGEIVRGTTDEIQFALSNIGSASANITSISLTDGNLGVTPTDPFTLNAQTSQTFTITFAPTDKGIFSDVLTITTSEGVFEVNIDAIAIGIPELSFSPAELTAEVESNSTTIIPLTLENVGDEMLVFEFPSFFDSEGGAGINRLTHRATGSQVDDSSYLNVVRAVMYKYLNGELLNPTNWQQEIIDSFDRSSENQTPASTDGYIYTFEEMTLSGSEFILLNDADFSGELTSVSGDFIIDAAGGATWASDLAVIFTTEPEINSSTVVLQVGGFTTYGPDGTKIEWGMGDAGTGATVDTSIEIPEPLNMDEIYVWVGHGWSTGSSSTWSGLISLQGVSDAPDFITGLNPASGQIDASLTQIIEITVDANGLELGEYISTVRLLTNAPDAQTVTIPVTIQVVETISDPEITVSYRDGWNLVGMAMEMEHETYHDIFNHAQENSLFKFSESGYQSVDVMNAGIGYWLLFGDSDNVLFTGEMIDNLSIELNEGWNLISGISSIVNLSSVSDETGILSGGLMYAYDGGYVPVNQFEPGKSYMLYATNSGTIHLNNTEVVLASNGVIQPDLPADVIGLNFETGKTTSQLYLSNDDISKFQTQFKLPPLPPVGSFDVRFDTNNRLHSGQNAEIHIQQNKEPVALSLDSDSFEMELIITEWAGPIELGTTILASGSTIEIQSQTERITVELSDAAIADLPTTLELHQNYPNPFNPVTVIGFSLPESSEVQLDVYNIAGQRVARLINGNISAGYQSVNFDASALSSGVYIYRLQAGGAVYTRKMMLVK